MQFWPFVAHLFRPSPGGRWLHIPTTFLLIVFISLLTVLPVKQGACADKQADKQIVPNIVLIMTDDK